MLPEASSHQRSQKQISGAKNNLGVFFPPNLFDDFFAKVDFWLSIKLKIFSVLDWVRKSGCIACLAP